MKQVHPNYTFDASTKTITLTGLNIAQDQLLLVTNSTRGVIYYNFASSSLRAQVTPSTNTTIVLTDASTLGHADSDQLVIYYDDQKTTVAVEASALPLPAGAATSNNQTAANASLSSIDSKIKNLPDFDALNFSGATLVTDATIGFTSGQILWAGTNANQSTTIAPAGTKGRAFLVRFFNNGSAGATLQGQFFGPGSLIGAVNNNNPSFRVEPAGRGWNNSPIAVLADNISTYYLFVAGLNSSSESSSGATHEILPFNLNFGVYTVSGTGYGRIAIYKIDVPPELALNSVIHGNLRKWLLSPSVTANAGIGLFNTAVKDGGGTSITSSGYNGLTNHLHTAGPSDSVLVVSGGQPATPPAAATLIGGTDGTHLRALSVDSSGRVNTNINPASSLPLPSGAATSANQTTANTSLANIDADIGAPGDAAATTDTGSFSLISLFKRLLSTKLPDQSSGRIPVTLASAGTNGSTAPTTANLYAGTDGTNLRAISVDSSGRANVNSLADKGSVSEASTQSITTGGTHQQVFASNSSRKYLLIQNISDTDMYLGLGFNPSNTTPAGLLLAKSGGGIVFESSYIPTSEVRIVCATTGKRFVALQG